jgi:poly(hydroxyalkanoate) granule-associated protein
MSDSKPTINITRGKKPSKPASASSGKSSASEADAPSAGSGFAESVRTLWLAGLGAVSLAEDVGAKTFQSLVEEGKAWESQRERPTQNAAPDDGPPSPVERLRKGGANAMASLERRVRDEVNDIITQVGIPRRQDVEALRDEVGQLSDKVDRLAEMLDQTHASDPEDASAD